jgi:molybdopterin-containing oxidoreductase family membrane subunit
MVLTIVIPIRAIFGLQDLITLRHFDNMSKVLLASGWIVVYSYIVETFISWYGANQFEQYMMWNRAFGQYGYFYWIVLFCNVIAIQPLWKRSLRQNLLFLWVLSLVVNVGMWLERYVIVVQSLHRDFMPGAWGMYSGTFWDWLTLLGSVGLFGSLLFLFLRLAPALSISEARELAEADAEARR